MMMTGDQIDALAERIAFQAVELLGPDEAPGALWQALILAFLEHHSLDALVFCVEGLIATLRANLVQRIKAEGSIQ